MKPTESKMAWDKYAHTWSNKKSNIDYEYEREKISKFWRIVDTLDPDKIGKDHYRTIFEYADEENWPAFISEVVNENMTKSELEKSQDPNHTGGRKFDGGKLQYGLLPPEALSEIVEVLMYGAEKYEPDNWRRVPDAHRRYFDAAQRHMWAYKMGEKYDPETGLNHMAHAACCLMFMIALDEEGLSRPNFKTETIDAEKL